MNINVYKYYAIQGIKMMLSIVIPIYNSSHYIKNTYKKLKGKAKALGVDYEFLFREDNGSDNSREVLKNLAAKDNKVRIFFNDRNMGLGYNLGKLFEDAKGEIVIYSNVDLSFDLDCFNDFFKAIASGEADACFASKYFDKKRNIPFYRIVASRAYYLLVRLLFGIKIKDVCTGFVMIKKSVFNKIKLKQKRFAIHVELADKLARNGFVLKEFDVSYRHKAGAFKISKHGLRIIVDTIAYWLFGRK